MKTIFTFFVSAGVLLSFAGTAPGQDDPPTETTDVAFDIKPQSCPNPVNTRSKGKLPAAILGTEDFDVSEIDVTSLMLEGVAPLRTDIEDVAAPVALTGAIVECSDCGDPGPDGIDDLTMKFDTQDILAAIEPVEDGEVRVLTVTGLLTDGTAISGVDVVCIKKKTTDFDDDGDVGFKDFIAFARQFGRKRLEMDYDERFDLDDDGEVTFLDFLAFVQAYAASRGQGNGPANSSGDDGDDNGNGKGNSGGKGGGAGKLATPATGIALLPLSPTGGSEMRLSILLTGAVTVEGYSLNLNYDPDVLEFVGATGMSGSRFNLADGGQTPAVQSLTGPGEVLLADAFPQDRWLAGDAQLAELTFRVLDQTAPVQIEILGATLAFGDGSIGQLAGVRLDDVHGAPSSYALHRNVPNPFNPATQIAYELPDAGSVSLVIYNVMGQRVRILTKAHQPAGSYRLTWDGRDALGREVSSGIYVLRMQANGFEQMRKMLLLK